MMQFACALGAILCFGVAWWHQPNWRRRTRWYWLWPFVCLLGMVLAILAVIGLPPYAPGPGPGCPYHC